MERIIWNPELSGVSELSVLEHLLILLYLDILSCQVKIDDQIKHFLSVTSSDNDGNVGDLCLADQVP